MTLLPKKNIILTTKIPGLTAERQYARAFGRAPVIYSGSGFYDCIPYVEPLPYSVDVNGHAYPAGTVGVRFAWHPGLDDGTETGNSVDFMGLVNVPAILPVGYTPRLERDHYYRPGQAGVATGQAWYSAGGQPTPPWHAGAFNQIRLADKIHDYWLTIPESHGEDAYAGTIVTSGWGTYATAGLRYIQWKGVQPGITVELRCNANGTSAGTGDTSLALFTNATAGNADSPLFTAGLQFALGVKRKLYFRTNPTPPDVIHLEAAARVDLPLPFATSGPNIFVPGGYLPGKLDVKLPV